MLMSSLQQSRRLSDSMSPILAKCDELLSSPKVVLNTIEAAGNLVDECQMASRVRSLSLRVSMQCLDDVCHSKEATIISGSRANSHPHATTRIRRLGPDLSTGVIC